MAATPRHQKSWVEKEKIAHQKSPLQLDTREPIRPGQTDNANKYQ